jgi:hypothetical protein
MSKVETKLQTETWIAMPWKQYIEVIENPIYQKSKSYYYRGNLRIEMLPVSFEHRKDHILLIASYCHSMRHSIQIPINGLDTCSFTKTRSERMSA